MQEVRPLTSSELYLSGSFGHKIVENLNKNIHVTSPNPNIKASYEFDGYEINITNENLLSIYGFFSGYQLEKTINKFNVYINNLINTIKDQHQRKDVIELANLELSRKSKYHILNIELLCSAAHNEQRKSKFNCLYYLMKEKSFYDLAKDNYEYFLFAIFDAQTSEISWEIYEKIIDDLLPSYNDDTGFLEKSEPVDVVVNSVDKMLTEEAKEIVQDSLKLAKIMD